MKKMILLVAIALGLNGCSDTFWIKVDSYGGTANVVCYSGTRLIFEGNSTGKVANSSSSNGYYFIDKLDNKLKEVSGNCIVTYSGHKKG